MQETIREREALTQQFQIIRDKTMALCHPLENEDYVIQCSEEVSPIKWHLAHTTWFFEIFILKKYLKPYKIFNAEFFNLYNSYYHSLGESYPKKRRGHLSRPLLKEILQYRIYVNEALIQFIEKIAESDWSELKSLITLGIHHEQQHQELILMDIKYNFSENPFFPRYIDTDVQPALKQELKQNSKPSPLSPLKFTYMEGGIVDIGNSGAEFSFDNELPKHQQILKPYLIANRLVTNGEYLEFIEAKGYQNPKYWLSQGYDTALKNHWQAPLYWKRINNRWHLFTLSGLIPLNLEEPISHLSYFEADAFANWSLARLPTEAEWEHCLVFNHHKMNIEEANFLETGLYHPRAVTDSHSESPSQADKIHQIYGDLWEWTSSAYAPYPGFKPLQGSLGEYNGKFMSGQMVLRGGSCATPQSHIRSTYRNYYQPDKRWQFAGLRLAKDV